MLIMMALALVLVVAGLAVLIWVFQGNRWRLESGRDAGLHPLPGEGQSRQTLAGADPLAVLRERYAAGEIDHEEFERRVEGLLRTDPDQHLPPT